MGYVSRPPTVAEIQAGLVLSSDLTALSSLCSAGFNSLPTLAQIQAGLPSNSSITALLASGVSIVKSIQYGSISASIGSSPATATINAVVASKAVVLYLGNMMSDGTSFSYRNSGTILTLTNSTTVTATWIDGGGGGSNPTMVVNFVVLEYT